MEYNDVKECLMVCPEFAGLGQSSVAALFWRGEEHTLDESEVIYAEGEPLDNTFCLLLSGDLVVRRAGEVVGGIFERQIFGEMAYFTNGHARTATVSVGSPQAVILKFQLSPEELGSSRLEGLRKSLALHTWSRFVSTTQGFGQ